jgi:cytochrome c553
MKRLLRWIGITLGALVVLALIASGLIYVRSERILGRTYEVPTVRVSVPNDAAAVREGERLVAVRGCFTDCHGRQGEGRVMFDQPMIARIVAPNLTSAVHRYNDAQLAGIIRQGVRPDGRSLLIMPSEAYVALTDEDLGRILAYLRSVPAVEGPGPSVSAGPLGRLGLAAGQFKTAAQLIADAPAPPQATGDEASLGRYLAWTTCAACHGTDLRGSSNPDFTSPTLQVVAAYSAESFLRLMRTGVALGDRQLPVMGPQARQNLKFLTDAEIAALYAYLRALPEAAQRP